MKKTNKFIANALLLSVVNILMRGIGVHHSALPQAVKAAIEDDFREHDALHVSHVAPEGIKGS